MRSFLNLWIEPNFLPPTNGVDIVIVSDAAATTSDRVTKCNAKFAIDV